jgi:predicted house-cleaning noncanonical NTP pyrophosphatase (MazG superfamily)
MKIITVCGSLKFEQDMKYYAEKLALEGNCVLSVIYPIKNKEEYTKEEKNILGKGHIKRIDISDAIFVVNKNGYIGEAVRKEIDYAKGLNKEIIYLENNNGEGNTKYFNKLVRDRIITIIENRGGKAVYETLDDDNYLKELNRKLVEEVNEFIEENAVEELADVYEVINTIIKNKKMDLNEIEEIRIKKREERGGFDSKIFLRNIIE